jgi:hypothetical protein
MARKLAGQTMDFRTGSRRTKARAGVGPEQQVQVGRFADCNKPTVTVKGFVQDI